MELSLDEIATANKDVLDQILADPRLLINAVLESYPSQTDTTDFHTPEILDTRLPPDVSAAMDRLIDHIEKTDNTWKNFRSLHTHIGLTYIRYDDDNLHGLVGSVQESDADSINEIVSEWAKASEQTDLFPTNAFAFMNLYLLERFFERHEDTFRQTLVRDNNRYHQTMGSLQAEGVPISEARKLAAFDAISVLPILTSFIDYQVHLEAGEDVPKWDVGAPLLG